MFVFSFSQSQATTGITFPIDIQEIAGVLPVLTFTCEFLASRPCAFSNSIVHVSSL